MSWPCINWIQLVRLIFFIRRKLAQWYKRVDGPPLGFRRVTIFREDFTFLSRELVVCSTRRGVVLWVAALLGTCHIIKDDRHLGSYSKFETTKKRGNLKKEMMLNIQSMTQHCCFFSTFNAFLVKNTHFFQKWLDHLQLMTSYLVTIATDCHQTGVVMCLRDVHSFWKLQMKMINRLVRLRVNILQNTSYDSL